MQDSRARFHRRTFALLATTLGSELLFACGDGLSTSGKRLVFRCRARADLLEFSNAFGFDLTLERVLVSIGPLRIFEGSPVARPLSPGKVFGVRAAHAHPGHYLAGGVLGEMLQPTSIDLALGESELATGQGVAGEAHSAQFSFRIPVAGPYAEELSDRVVLVRGVARDSAGPRPFEAAATIEDVLDDSGAPLVDGCELSGGPIASDGLVTLSLRPSIWFDQVDFTAMPISTTPDEGVALDRDSALHRAFARGLKKAAGYRFTYRHNTP